VRVPLGKPLPPHIERLIERGDELQMLPVKKLCST
jgi:hypothetical protein